ncbi:MAG TPA: ATPase, T2SS/T4P/T4SS family [Candidatus Hydrogenedentes bacterium]|jgi:type IV pilus assembly protein PilB|nr:MAG: Type II secretion system protein E [Candidatus Hydrogenedentes bacterium ADurb.Bin170]HNZ47888.1 ATPase, T2SS/T4P/T4SS family [Candidatus Hydrogenedentota bacterium]HOR49701.1 ATPase, T2SS/T4P/T4SS family [Candidatus Hydrogenedentota bacterium]HPK23869.1 ATPase, T2SS/T4P/T4SS family [Candidatus Hydrogenedentota bacterium]HPX86566.1 ATPase, T2SS/T4P/T4SS family [Candidatus Hydrogenedentota bacterium]
MPAVLQKARPLGEILIDQGTISPLHLDEALQRQRLTGDLIGRILVSLGHATEQNIIEALGMQQGMVRVDLSKRNIPVEIIKMLSGDVAQFYGVIPISFENNTLTVAMSDPLNMQTLDDLRQITGLDVQGAISTPEEVSAAWKKNYSFETGSVGAMLDELKELVGTEELSLEELGQQEILSNVDNLVELAQQPEVIKIVNLIFLTALQKRASDIHFEVYEEDFRIRIRIDGVLHEVVHPPKASCIAIVSRIKIISNMDIGERRLPQDARIELKIGDSLIDIRVATLPSLYGEGVVMRILDRTAVRIDLDQLGLSQGARKKVDTVINKPNGIMLVTGPTGCGKTTTLYACLNILNTPEVKIITTEDPVELQIERLVQCQVHEEVGLTFAACLRAILRQDPDIVMVGEIRDLETAKIAVEASLTGHLVLSTLHTNSAPETITRLLDMDVEPFMITASLEAVLAQRLVRVLCKACRERYTPEKEEMDELSVPQAWRNDPKFAFFRPKGCAACDYVGYMGRTGLYEVMLVDEAVRELILERAMAHELRTYARKHQNMVILREEGLVKCIQGITSAAEVIAKTDRYED